MIKSVNFAQKGINFRSEQLVLEKNTDDETRILPNNIKTRVKQGFQKTSSAFLDYPVRGFRGDINSDFYEFLTMGIVPYLTGSVTMMYLFNCVIKHLPLWNDRAAAAKIGNKMALGVLLYGVMKTLSKNLVTQPVKMATGVDVEMPYENIVYPLPKKPAEQAKIDVKHQQRKVFDSKEFYRKDLLEQEYFDKVGKKLGLGENLNDSRGEVGPIIQNIVATTNTAKSISSYMWGGVGVMLATQEPWQELFITIQKRLPYLGSKTETKIERAFGKFGKFTEEFLISSEIFAKAFVKSFQTMWKGTNASSAFMRHSGKAFLGLATLSTVGLTANSILRAKNLAKNNNLRTIDQSKESTVI